MGRLSLVGLAAFAACSGSDRPACTSDECAVVTITTYTQTRASGARLSPRAGPCDTTGERDPHVPIVIHAPDGSNWLDETDENGDLTVEVLPGSGVTASYPADSCGGQHFTTFLAVEAGDHLRFGSWLAVPEQIGSMTVTWPAQTAVEHFEVIHTCDSLFRNPFGYDTSAAIPIYSTCSTVTPTPETGSVLVVGYGWDGAPALWGSVAGFPLVDGGSVAIAEFLPATTQAVEMTGIPSSVGHAFVNVSPRIGANATVRPFVTAFGTPLDGRLSAVGSWTAASDVVFLEAGFEGIEHGTQFWWQTVPPAETITMADPAILPWVDAGSVTVDPGSRVFQWTQTGEGRYDGATAFATWARQKSDGWEFFQWSLIVPPGLTSLTIPGLPDSLADLGPNPADDVEGTVVLVERSDITRLHQMPFWEALDVPRDREDFPLAIRSGP